MSDIYEFITCLLPPALLWLLMLLACVLWLIIAYKHTVFGMDARLLARLIAPLLPLLVMYGSIFYEEAMGIPVNLDRSVALSRLTWIWLLLGLNTLMIRALYREWLYEHR
jgi:hypothetical protein